jgi:ABC-type uncharacterized transport system involved in gliding motility auxiliary subunit
MERRLGILFAMGVLLLGLAALLSATRGGFSGWSAGLVTAGGIVWTVAVVVSWRGITSYLLRRSTRYGLNALLLSFFVAVILFMIGFIGDRHSWRRDLSATREFTLSEKTLNVLQGISKPIDIYVYYERASREAVRDLLVEYSRRNRGLQIRIEDLNKNPELAERFGVTELGTIVFDAGDKVLRLRTFGEEDITNALIKVSRPGQKSVYFLSGHGEKSFEDKGVFGYSIAATALQRENYQPKALDLVAAGEVASDCEVLVVSGAKSGVLDQEIQAIRRYMNKRGRLFCLFDPRFESNLEGWVAVWGIHVGHDRIVDPSPTGQLLGRGPTTPLVNRYGVHPITKQFREPTYFQNARSVRRLQLYGGSAQTAALVFSSAQSWAETNVFSSQVGFDEDDLAGPVSIAMAARIDVEGLHPEIDAAVVRVPGDEVVSREALEGAGGLTRSEARVVVFGDSDFAANQSFNDMGNGNLFLNCMAWLSEDEDLIAVRPKVSDSRSVTLSLAQIKMLNVVSIFILPGLVFVSALTVLLRRRARG